MVSIIPRRNYFVLGGRHMGAKRISFKLRGLLGEVIYQQLLDAGLNPHQVCERIVMDYFRGLEKAYLGALEARNAEVTIDTTGTLAGSGVSSDTSEEAPTGSDIPHTGDGSVREDAGLGSGDGAGGTDRGRGD